MGKNIGFQYGVVKLNPSETANAKTTFRRNIFQARDIIQYPGNTC
jgi:hypothetical protein